MVPTRCGELAVHRTTGDGDTLVCLHGFTLGGAMFATFSDVSGVAVAAPDLPGHGATTVAPVDLASTMAALRDWIADRFAAQVAAGGIDVLGYSQGGRIALHLAMTHPELVARIVVVSAGPGLPEAERTVRHAADSMLADHIEEVGLDRFLDEWLANPLINASGGATDADRRLRTGNSAAGLAAALRGLGQGVLAPVDPSELAVPSLWVAGAEDLHYIEIADRSARTSGGDLVVIEGAGHNVVADAPHLLADAVAGFRRT